MFYLIENNFIFVVLVFYNCYFDIIDKICKKFDLDEKCMLDFKFGKIQVIMVGKMGGGKRFILKDLKGKEDKNFYY